MRKSIIYVAVLSASVLLSSLLFHTNTFAAPVVGFKPGNIIDDATFTNAASMTEGQIQDFLQSKVSSCDTNGQQASELGSGDVNHDGLVNATDFALADYNKDGVIQRWEYGKANYNQSTFTCLRDYKSSDGRSAAQIILSTAQKYTINPQVLLVLLQKEQGLITDTWPLDIQYRSATGYGCPDGAPCDSQYYGLANQVDWTGKMFRAILNQSSSWYSPYHLGDNQILWNPVASCGTSTVNIENLSTVALYDYTPYRPNQAALDAGWNRSADACSSYGNRNFYLYFNEWFGGYLISTTDTGNLYIRGANATYYQITTYAQLKGLGIDIAKLRVYTTTSAYLGSLSTAGPLTSAVQFNSLGDVYSIDSNQLHYFTAAAYRAYGSPTISNLASGLDGGIIPRGSNMTTVLAENNVGNLYSISNGEKRYISGASFGADGYSNIPITWMSGFYFNSLPVGAPILPAGALIQTSDTKVSSILNSDRSTKRAISAGAMASISYRPYVDSSAVLDKIPTTSDTPISVLSKDSIGNLYIVDGTKKVLLSPTLLSSLNKQATDFVATDDLYLNKFTTIAPAGSTLLFWLDGGARVYRSENGEMVAIINQTDFQKFGYDFKNVVDLNSSTVSQLFINNDRIALPAGTLFKLPSAGRVYVIDNAAVAHLIPTGNLFNDFSLSWSSVRDMNQATLDYYNKTNAIPLSALVTTADGNRWIVTNGRQYGLPAQLSLAYDPTATQYTPVDTSTMASSIRSNDATRFVRVGTDGRVYYMDNGIKYPLGSVSAFQSRGGSSWDLVVSISQSAADLFPTGQILY